jgi:CO/xanthine dehydrogenase Mo-binding subunit
VEVDIETGHVYLARVISANDVGRAVNPQLIQGQIEGAVVQAQGYAIMEHLIVHDGKILNPYLSTYLIPTVLDVPREVKSLILEYPDPLGPWGVRGMAEMPFLPPRPLSRRCTTRRHLVRHPSFRRVGGASGGFGVV